MYILTIEERKNMSETDKKWYFKEVEDMKPYDEIIILKNNKDFKGQK